MLVLVLMMLDLLSRSGDILAYPGNGEAELLRYVSLRVPQLIARFLPYSVLLATIITLATFNQNSEVVRDEGRGPVGAPDPRPAGARRAVRSPGCSSPSTSASCSARTRARRPGKRSDYGPVPTDPTSTPTSISTTATMSCWPSQIEGTGPRT
jgi:lipopolysaccharide export system permease protein